MKIITATRELAAFCQRAHECAYVTIDTEFERERTYFAKLCLIQMALPSRGPEDAVLIDPIQGNVNLAPFYAILQSESVIKVMHAARQDIEIFFEDSGRIPRRIYDTQVAAMICGYGDQRGYADLVKTICGMTISKSSRNTNWSRRPLDGRQKLYALGDVTHLRDIYEYLDSKIRQMGREEWGAEEMRALTDPETYVNHPEDAWRRLKHGKASSEYLSVLRELAAFRENQAKSGNIQRGRVLKDEVLLELASSKPLSIQEIGRSRLIPKRACGGQIAEGILKAVRAGIDCPPELHPRTGSAMADSRQSNSALADLLRVLLKAKAEEYGVSARLVAKTADINALSEGKRNLAVLGGWRMEVFGRDALRICDGKSALVAREGRVVMVDL
ncbi:MAG: ribonuclease D [Roseovarius sp.]|nr:ribonuclease D [Roseovarius sp.]